MVDFKVRFLHIGHDGRKDWLARPDQASGWAQWSDAQQVARQHTGLVVDLFDGQMSLL